MVIVSCCNRMLLVCLCLCASGLDLVFARLRLIGLVVFLNTPTGYNYIGAGVASLWNLSTAFIIGSGSVVLLSAFELLCSL